MKLDLKHSNRVWNAVYIAVIGVALMATAGQAATITYVGKISNATDYSDAGLNIGNAGFWFPRFGLSSPQTGLARDVGAYTASLPSWTSFDYTTGANRTFSIDAGGVQSEGGNSTFANLTLPDGTFGRSGSTFDPQAANNSNNSINRIQLGAGTPNTFYFSVIEDSSAGKYNSSGRVRARGDDGGVGVDPAVYPGGGAPLTFDGTPDVYVFRYDGFGAGDYIKLQLNGGANGGGFGGLLFDVTNPVPEPSSVVLLGLGMIACVVSAHRRLNARAGC
jgi:hypothetical protein